MRKTVFLCLLSLLFVLLLLPVGAAQFEPIDDRAGLLADEEQFRTQNADSAENCGVRYFLLTDTAAEALSDKEIFARCGITKKDDAAVLLVRYTGGKYYYDMYTYGDAYDAFSDADIDRILDDTGVYNNLKSGNVEAGAARWRTLCVNDIAKYAEKQAAKEAARIPRGIVITLVSFVLAGGIAVLCVALYYRKKVHGEIYPLERYAKLDLQVKNDRFVGSYITRVRVQSNNSSGGRSSGGGGGGGHRGGR